MGNTYNDISLIHGIDPLRLNELPYALAKCLIDRLPRSREHQERVVEQGLLRALVIAFPSKA